MKKLISIMLIMATIIVLFIGCSSPRVQPDITKWDTTGLPVDESWVGPPKTWFSDFGPGDTETQTIVIHAPKTYTILKLVNTIDGDNGILEQKLDVPLSLDGKSPFEIESAYSGESPVLRSYDPNTQIATISGFAPVKMERIVKFTYVPDYIECSLYFGIPMGTDSGKELVEKVNFTPIGEYASDWVIFPESNLDYLTVKLKPQETRNIQVVLSVPEDVDLPENWEFRIGIANTTGFEYAKGITVSSEINCKFLVSKNELRLLE